MKLEDIYNMWDEDSIIKREQLDEESLKISRLHSKYLRIYTNEKLMLKQYEADFKILRLEKYEFYTQGPTQEAFDKGWRLPACGKVLKADSALYIDADKDIINASLKIGLQKEKISFLDAVVHQLGQRSFNIKNAIDYVKWSAGLL